MGEREREKERDGGVRGGGEGGEEKDRSGRDVERAVTGKPSTTEQRQSARWSCPARLQTGSGRGVAAELNYYKLPRHSYRMYAPGPRP